jgi:hypothetical protein
MSQELRCGFTAENTIWIDFDAKGDKEKKLISLEFVSLMSFTGRHSEQTD